MRSHLPSKLSPLAHAIALGCVTLASTAHAQTLSELVVSASRAEQQSFDAPASVQAVSRETIEAAGPQVNVSELLTPLSK